MASRKNNSILESEYVTPHVEKCTIEEILKHPQFFRGHVRTEIGNIYTSDEFKKKSDEVLGRKLP